MIHLAVNFLSVSISSEKPTLWRQRPALGRAMRDQGFNLKREANPLATGLADPARGYHHGFNLKREANPLATHPVNNQRPRRIFVSISSEKPTLWRHTPQRLWDVPIPQFQSQARSQPSGDATAIDGRSNDLSFNLKREANPLATRNLHFAGSQQGVVSISSEKPTLWRHLR